MNEWEFRVCFNTLISTSSLYDKSFLEFTEGGRKGAGGPFPTWAGCTPWGLYLRYLEGGSKGAEGPFATWTGCMPLDFTFPWPFSVLTGGILLRVFEGLTLGLGRDFAVKLDEL